ncbi:hypothetical protein F5Y16DRAFT_345253 [Xylariaceae sp. FL0255]|nr:hypothetical protein F5Y16DRAFT_345253 [Xylariaceae sp. FL0255]
MSLKTIFALVLAAAAGLTKAQFPIMRDCTFNAYTSTDCSGDAVSSSVPYYVTCFADAGVALPSFSLEGPECYEIAVNGYSDDVCGGAPDAFDYAEAIPVDEAGCYQFESGILSATWSFYSA